MEPQSIPGSPDDDDDVYWDQAGAAQQAAMPSFSRCATPTVLVDSPRLSKPQRAHKSQGNRIHVCVRVRPPFMSELTGGFANGELGVVIRKERITLKASPFNGALRDAAFRFDSVIGPEGSQEDVYAIAAEPLVAEVLSGYNSTIICYGQTGSGKTYTMSNTAPGARGILWQAVDALFHTMRSAEHAQKFEYTVGVQLAQIYMEQIEDLLVEGPSARPLAIRESPQDGVYVEDLSSRPAARTEDVVALVSEGYSRRATAATRMNYNSSRSHAVLVLTVDRRERSARPLGGRGKARGLKTLRRGRLICVDLAGSERVKKSEVVGLQLDEARAVNRSLSALGNVVAALANHAPHVPFRDSKLTRLLQDYLRGNARISVVVNVSPASSNYQESLSALAFAKRAMCVQTAAVVNVQLDDNKARGGPPVGGPPVAGGLAGPEGRADPQAEARASRAEAEELRADLGIFVVENERLRAEVERLKQEADAMRVEHAQQLDAWTERLTAEDARLLDERLDGVARERESERVAWEGTIQRWREALDLEREARRSAEAREKAALARQEALWRQERDGLEAEIERLRSGKALADEAAATSEALVVELQREGSEARRRAREDPLEVGPAGEGEAAADPAEPGEEGPRQPHCTPDLVRRRPARLEEEAGEREARPERAEAEAQTEGPTQEEEEARREEEAVRREAEAAEAQRMLADCHALLAGEMAGRKELEDRNRELEERVAELLECTRLQTRALKAAEAEAASLRSVTSTRSLPAELQGTAALERLSSHATAALSGGKGAAVRRRLDVGGAQGGGGGEAEPSPSDVQEVTPAAGGGQLLPLSPTRLRFEDEDRENRDPATGMTRQEAAGKAANKKPSRGAGSAIVRFLLCSRKAKDATPRKPLPPTPRKAGLAGLGPAPRTALDPVAAAAIPSRIPTAPRPVADRL